MVQMKEKYPDCKFAFYSFDWVVNILEDYTINAIDKRRTEIFDFFQHFSQPAVESDSISLFIES